MTVNSIREPERDLPVRGEYDVVVLGGGPAGIAAAASAAAQGRKTLMVERYGFLGGMGTAAGVTGFCGLYANVHGEHRQVVHVGASLGTVGRSVRRVGSWSSELRTRVRARLSRDRTVPTGIARASATSA